MNKKIEDAIGEESETHIQEICRSIYEDALEPAKAESENIIQRAKGEAMRIVEDARKEARAITDEASSKANQEKKIAKAAIEQGCKQALESLKQKIEKSLFNNELNKWVNEQMQDPYLPAKLIAAVIEGLQREGIEANFSAYIAKECCVDSINAILAENVLKKLKENSVLIGDFQGGARVFWHEKQLQVDLSNEALQEIVSDYVREDFHHLLFQATQE